MNTYEINGQAYSTQAGIRSDVAGGYVPLVELPMMSDYQWQAKALEHRITHRENYEGCEDVDGVIAQLRTWLAEHTPVS